MIHLKKWLKIVFFVISSLAVTHLYAIDFSSPVGYWKTIDDVTSEPKSIISIYMTANHTLNGKIIKIFPKPDEDPNKICTLCKGDKHNQRIVGMIILENMRKQDEQWVGGEILDPKNGKTYRCTLRVIQAGAKLKVRGFIGIPALGRTQTWERI